MFIILLDILLSTNCIVCIMWKLACWFDISCFCCCCSSIVLCICFISYFCVRRVVVRRTTACDLVFIFFYFLRFCALYYFFVLFLLLIRSRILLDYIFYLCHFQFCFQSWLSREHLDLVLSFGTKPHALNNMEAVWHDKWTKIASDFFSEIRRGIAFHYNDRKASERYVVQFKVQLMYRIILYEYFVIKLWWRNPFIECSNLRHFHITIYYYLRFHWHFPVLSLYLSNLCSFLLSYLVLGKLMARSSKWIELKWLINRQWNSLWPSIWILPCHSDQRWLPY